MLFLVLLGDDTEATQSRSHLGSSRRGWDAEVTFGRGLSTVVFTLGNSSMGLRNTRSNHDVKVTTKDDPKGLDIFEAICNTMTSRIGLVRPTFYECST